MRSDPERENMILYKLQASFFKRANNYRALLRKMKMRCGPQRGNQVLGERERRREREKEREREGEKTRKRERERERERERDRERERERERGGSERKRGIKMKKERECVPVVEAETAAKGS